MPITVVDELFRDMYRDDMMCRFPRRLIQDVIPTRLISDVHHLHYMMCRFPIIIPDAMKISAKAASEGS
jgi:hypothetical protein